MRRALIFLARVHEGHDQQIGQKGAALILGDEDERFEDFLEVRRPRVARKLPDGDYNVLSSHGSYSSRKVF